MREEKPTLINWEHIFEGTYNINGVKARWISEEKFEQLQKENELLKKENEGFLRLMKDANININAIGESNLHFARRVEELEQEIRHIQNDVIMNQDNELALLKRKLEVAVNHLDSIGNDLCLEPIRLSTLAKEALKEIEALK